MTTTHDEARPVTTDDARDHHGSVRQRLGVAGLSAVSWLACRLPESPLVAAAELVGDAWYRLDRRRRDQARRNLARVVGWLAANEHSSEAVRSAAADPAALEGLVRSAFRHYARYYLDVARAPAFRPAYVAERLSVEHPDNVEAAFSSGPVICIGLHFGALELQAYYGAVSTGRTIVIPMETVDDPALQRYFVRTRGSIGIRIVGLREARRELATALQRGDAVGIVADRDLTGGGIETSLFGAPTSLPLGPALLAVESGAPAWVTTVRRAGPGRYLGRIEPLPVPSDGSRRERVTALVERMARAFEDEIALAPDQWWAVFFPIWPDLEEGGR